MEKRQQEQKRWTIRIIRRDTLRKNGRDKERINEKLGIKRKCRSGEEVEINAKNTSV
jgi:hypothetical protein